ncbi:MAG: alcohol acetyltransferase [Clostridia bacterium]|nr:alcohol acetyltransferase [Clostridia bacterium]
MRFLDTHKHIFNGRDWLKLDNAAKVFPAQNTKTWSNIIRYSLNLTEEINPEILEKALKDILPRFPSMCVEIKRGFFWYYFQYNNRTPVILEDTRNQCIPIKYSESNRFLFKIYYYKKRLSIEAFHALTDGYGCEVFLNTLAAQYLRYLGHNISCGGSVFDITEKPKQCELEDSFVKNATPGAKASRSKPNVYHRTGEKQPAFCSHIILGYMPVDKIKELCKKYSATITEFFTAVLVDIYLDFQKREEKKQKEISIQIPVNSRNQFDSQTLRNFSVCYSFRLDPSLGEYTFEEIIRQVSLYLRYVNNPKTLGAMFSSNVKLETFPLMRIIPLVIKDLAIGISYALTAESTTTALFTNLGKVVLPPEMYQFVESCILMPSPGLLNGGRMGAVSVGNTFTIAVANCYNDTDIERAFFSKLVEMGIPVEIESNLF